MLLRGSFQQAEFAADLGQVYRGEGSDEYKNPRDFFQRTFITHGLHSCWPARSNASREQAEIRSSSFRRISAAGKRIRCSLCTICSREGGEGVPGIESVLTAAGVTSLRKRGARCWSEPN